MSGLFIALAVVGAILGIAFPFIVRRQYRRKRERYPRVYWIASALGFECGAFAVMLVALLGLSDFDFRKPQLQLWMGAIEVLAILAAIGMGVCAYFELRYTIRRASETQ